MSALHGLQQGEGNSVAENTTDEDFYLEKSKEYRLGVILQRKEEEKVIVRAITTLSRANHSSDRLLVLAAGESTDWHGEG